MRRSWFSPQPADAVAAPGRSRGQPPRQPPTRQAPPAARPTEQPAAARHRLRARTRSRLATTKRAPQPKQSRPAKKAFVNPWVLSWRTAAEPKAKPRLVDDHHQLLLEALEVVAGRKDLVEAAAGTPFIVAQRELLGLADVEHQGAWFISRMSSWDEMAANAVARKRDSLATTCDQGQHRGSGQQQVVGEVFDEAFHRGCAL